MLLSRRNMLKLSTAGGALAAIQSCGNPEDSSESSAGTPEDCSRRPTVEELDRAAAAPLLKLDGLTSAVIIDSIQLLQRGREQVVHVRSKDGAEGISFTNGRANFRPILEDRIIPFFLGKDARQLESDLLFELYRYRSNYKLQGLAFWSAQAWVEFAILDMLGRVAGKSMNELFGGGVRQSAPFYVASGRRDSTPEEEADYLVQLVEETGAKAVKFRVGGRMSRNRDSVPGRTESLIRLARKTLGDGIDIHADSNSSYDPPEAIKVGRILEEVNAVFFEEPCPFDHLEDTKKVADALTIPVAGGEQEFSERRFRWMIHNRGVDIVQPDLHYYDGMIRSLKVAKMAALANMPTTPHISGGFGFVYVLHFTACVNDVGSYQEYKRGIERYTGLVRTGARNTKRSLVHSQGPRRGDQGYQGGSPRNPPGRVDWARRRAVELPRSERGKEGPRLSVFKWMAGGATAGESILRITALICRSGDPQSDDEVT